MPDRELILDGLLDGRRLRFPLESGRCRVGRAARNDLVLTDLSVSREHAEITVMEDGVEVRDLGSRNGTAVDGRRVVDAVEVRVGQTIRFGAEHVVFRLVEDLPFDWQASLLPAELSPNEAIKIQALAGSRGSDLLGEADIEPAIEINGVAAAAEAGHLLVLPNTPLDAITELSELTRRIIPWRRAAVLVSEPTGSLPALLVNHGSRERPRRLLLSAEAWAELSRDRGPLLITSVRGDVETAEAEGEASGGAPEAVVVPVLERGRVIGALYLEIPAVTPVLTPLRLRTLTLFSDLLSVRLSQARASRALRDRERLEREMSLAADIQRRLLSNARIDRDGYEALARQIPCYEVAGDLYDISVREDGKVILVLGDATGKGMGAALLMSNVMAAFRALCTEITDPSELAARLHQQLLCYTEPWQFVTLFLGVLNPAQHTLEYVNAGHCAPLLMTPDGGCSRLKSTGVPLGILRDADYPWESAVMSPQSLLCVYSDGVTEASCAGDIYGEDRLVRALAGLRSLPAEDLVDQLIRGVREFVQEQPLEDDLTLMVVRRHGMPRPPA